MTARWQTSSIETISNFQRFNARIVRSRKLGVISRDLSGWKRAVRDGRTRWNRSTTPAPPVRHCIIRA